MPKRTDIGKSLTVLSACLLYASLTAAECVVVTALQPQLSSKKVQITVFADGKPSQHAAVEVDLIANGKETLVSLFTDDYGVVKLPRLKPGNYSIGATSADALQSNFLLLHVLDHAGGKETVFSLQLQPTFTSAAEPTLVGAAKMPASERIQAFKGIVEDVTGAGVPGALIEIFPRNSGDSTKIVRFKTDGSGHFSATLASGTYTAIVRAPGFRDWRLVFEIARDGEAKELHAQVQIWSC
jgi:protocatechuate 3,4-dioxygenase beta subunit